MNTSPSKSRGIAMVSGLIAAVVTSSVVSRLTPDGNLVVTLVPGVAIGLAVFGLVRWRFRRGEAAG
jgi:hypothetical protein